MFQELTPLKEQFIKALESLPDSVIIPINGKFERHNLAEKREQDIAKLNSYWEFVADNYQNAVIALIGMVNVGKSALGNLLLHGGESAFFPEAPVRETSQPSQVNLDRQTILIDLPGLGSVLEEEDDTVVKMFIRRANVLLVVISVDSPITKHLYEFFQSDILKNHAAQRVVIVLNKIDMWDTIPETHRKKELLRYTEFLIKGNKQLGFPGVGQLFDYEIPVIPLSIKHIRNKADVHSEQVLRDMNYLHTMTNIIFL